MASYAVLATLARTIDQTLNDPKLSPFVHDKEPQMRSLHEHITRLRRFVNDYPKKASTLEEQISDLASRADKIVDSYMTQLLDSYYRSSMKLEKSEIAASPHVTASIENEMDEILRRIEKMTVEESKDGDHHPHRTDSSTSSSLQKAPTPTLGKEVMIGFDEDLLKIKKRLYVEGSKFEVIPIYGMGGIGKTMLARNVYDDPLVVEHFQVRAWVRVSQDYDLEQMLTNLLSFVKPGTGEQVSKNKSLDVYQNLKGKRFFIVLDDVWSEEAFSELRNIFPDECNGSRVLLTTRIKQLADHRNFARPVHEVKLMDEDQSWNLLTHKVFGKIGNCPKKELEPIGRTIAKSCKGLPLAIVVMAGILAELGPNQDSWSSMAENVKDAFASIYKQLEKILLLSYSNLPYYLRSCFLYMGNFPEDSDIRVSNLTKLWAAEGFLKPPSERPSSESLSSESSNELAAEVYLEDLVKRSLVFVARMKTNERIKSCGIHDLVREMCIKRSEREGFLQHVKERYPKRSDEEEIDNTNWLEKYKSYSDSIQTAQSFKNGLGTSIHIFRSLKVLELLNVKFRSFPVEILELFLLKFLALGHVAEVPSSISKLWNLETFVVHPRGISTSYLPYIVTLPSTIWTMTKLRHLVSFSYGTLPNPEEGSCALENLQTLNAVINCECKEWISEMIPNVKKLGIYFVGTRKAEYSLDNLVHLRQLEKLKLSVLIPFSAPQKLNLAFPETLRKLTLRGCRLPWEDTKIIGSLPNLEVLKLKRHAFQGDEWETQDEEFPKLKYLLLEELDLLRWVTDPYHFPKLKSLIIRDCQDLEKLPGDVGEFQSLEMIEVVGNKESLVNSAKEIRQKQEDIGNQVIKVLVKSYA